MRISTALILQPISELLIDNAVLAHHQYRNPDQAVRDQAAVTAVAPAIDLPHQFLQLRNKKFNSDKVAKL
jgi:hypothetical protein